MIRVRRSPEEARFLGLWTAAWLAALLLAGVLRIGDLAVQWPVLLVPLVWALIAARPRRAARVARDADARRGDAWSREPPPARQYPQTRELQWRPDVPRSRDHRRERDHGWDDWDR